MHDEYPTLEKSHAKLIKSYALQAISDELNSVAALKTYIDGGFEAAIELLLSNKGRAIITGIGKSAIIAQKIVATMNSTGQPAIFMHAADAVHGDLGIIQKGDVVIAISKSGNTPEIKLLAPLLKNFGNPLIAMVGNVNSELAGLADVVINTTIDKEACPNNLAPTTSTTAQLIMGDALAVTLLRMRNFSDDDFGRYHPGGALGKRLYLRCGDIAAANAKPAVMPEASIKEVILSISANRLGAATVVNTTGQVLGIITDGDIRRMLESHDNLHNLKASDIMGNNPASVDWDTMATEAAEIMKTRKISQLIVLKNDNYAGMVHLHDLNREGII